MEDSAPGQQIPLSFNKYEQIDFDLFEVGQNQAACQYLQDLAGGKVQQNAYLWGQAGSGKSHLLQATCTVAATRELPLAYVPLRELADLSPAMLDDLESLSLVCLDDIDNIAGDPVWEEAIFHLFNRLRDAAVPLLMTARHSALGSPIQLADLKSRLAWDQVFHLHTLDENQALQSLVHRARSRGFDLPDEVASYLIKRVARDMHSLFSTLDKLDRASLVAKKKLTIPFVKDLLD